MKHVVLTATVFLCLCITARAAEKSAEFRDASDAPLMVVIPAGEFTMGSPESEPNRRPAESPRHRVTIDSAFAVGKFNVTRGEYAAFVAATGYTPKGDCHVRSAKDDEWVLKAGARWDNPGFAQTDNDPVICMTFDDAMAYVNWLKAKTGQKYRLLSEAEYEYAARAGTTTAYYWGDEPGKGNANCKGCGSAWDNRQPSPSGSFAPNAFGLYDMSGNVWSWVADCWNLDYTGAPTDGSAWTTKGDCVRHMRRGGSWQDDTRYPRVANRARYPIADRYTIFGFRVAREL